MLDSREETRRISGEKCEIKKGGSVYECRLEDISFSGAKVTCLDFLQETWPGDKFELHLFNEIADIPCQVTHISASSIGLRFIHLPFYEI